MSHKCEHGMMSWECMICTDKVKLKQIQSASKSFIDSNVWDGEDRSGASNDRASFNPDDLQELINDMLEFIYYGE